MSGHITIRNDTCNYCKKTGHYNRKCQGKRGSNRGLAGHIHGEAGVDDQLVGNDDVSSQHDVSVKCVNDHHLKLHGSDSYSSEDYIFMSIRKRKEEKELKKARLRLPIKINDKLAIA